MSRLTDEELGELNNIVDALLPSRGLDLFGDAFAELRERRAADLTAQDVEALRGSVVHHIDPVKARIARRALDKLLAREVWR